MLLQSSYTSRAHLGFRYESQVLRQTLSRQVYFAVSALCTGSLMFLLRLPCSTRVARSTKDSYPYSISGESEADLIALFPIRTDGMSE
jgi:hypothetical protein